MCFRPLPSSPWRTIGAVLFSCRQPADSNLNTSCPGLNFLNFDQKLAKMALSRSGSGFTKPHSTCQQLLRNMKSAQSSIFKIGMFTDGSSVFRTDLFTGSAKPYLVTISLLQSLSDFFSLLRANSANPPERLADDNPTSATTFWAAEIADLQEASESKG